MLELWYPISDSASFVGALSLVACILSFAEIIRRHKKWLIRWANTSSSSLGADGKKSSGAKASDQSGRQSYKDVFPPSKRESLVALKAVSPQRHEKAAKVALDPQNLQNHLVGFCDDYKTTSESKYTCSGLSIGEIKSLGSFPDYSLLSEVPRPQPYNSFDIETALPRPYRPLRWAYHQTMSLSKMETDFWIELENTYVDRICERQKLYADHKGDVLQYLPGSELACHELMEMALLFLCDRYPHYFSLSEDKSTFANKIMGTTSDLLSTPPLIVLLDNVPEDFALMIRNPEDGYYYFRAGIICSAIGWTLGQKIGCGLHEIHGEVPDYKEKMQFSMDRYFSKMPCDKPIQRGSWFFEIDQPLFMPPGDPREQRMKFQDAELKGKDISLRVDWQTLRRLPLSGSVVFNFKALFTPVTEFHDEPFIPSLILKLLNESKESILKYKHIWHIEHVVKPLMAQFEREQIAKGLIPKDWNHHTLDESPFFPGWEDKWHQQQGF